MSRRVVIALASVLAGVSGVMLWRWQERHPMGAIAPWCAERYAAARTARDSAAVDSLRVLGSRGLARSRTCAAARAAEVAGGVRP